MKILIKAAGAIFMGLATGPALAQNPEVLPTLPGKLNYAVDINNAGVIIGNAYSRDASSVQPFHIKNGQITVLPGYTNAFVRSINDAGVIVGGANKPGDENLVAVIWVDGKPVELESYGLGSAAYDINLAGDVVGSVNTNFGTVPAVWRKGKLAILSTLYDNGGVANAIDNQGVISGYSVSQNYFDQSPTQWVADVPAALPVTFGEDYAGVLGVAKSRGGVTSGYLVVKEFYDGDQFYYHNLAVAWQNNEFRVLQRPTGKGNSIAWGVNAGGMLYGSTTDEQGYTTPTVWEGDGAVRLPLQEGRSASAVAANESGLVIGYDHTNFDPIPVLWRLNTLNRISMANQQISTSGKITLQANVTRAGRPVANKTMEFRLNDKRIGTAKSDIKGIVRFTYQMPGTSRGRQQIMASLGGSNYLFRNVVVGKATTRAAISPSRARVGKKATFTASLRSEDMNVALPGKTLVLSIGGKAVAKATTDKNGVAKLAWRVPANMTHSEMPIEIQYAGDGNNLSTVGRAKLYITR
jgi:hypothetical protein